VVAWWTSDPGILSVQVHKITTTTKTTWYSEYNSQHVSIMLSN